MAKHTRFGMTPAPTPTPTPRVVPETPVVMNSAAQWHTSVPTNTQVQYVYTYTYSTRTGSRSRSGKLRYVVQCVSDYKYVVQHVYSTERIVRTQSLARAAPALGAAPLPRRRVERIRGFKSAPPARGTRSGQVDRRSRSKQRFEKIEIG
eukprot:31413-Pelagococcus_subviridis.AAC.8